MAQPLVAQRNHIALLIANRRAIGERSVKGVLVLIATSNRDARQYEALVGDAEDRPVLLAGNARLQLVFAVGAAELILAESVFGADDRGPVGAIAGIIESLIRVNAGRVGDLGLDACDE